eukprot:TRINITY_DN1339_c0_g1_i10.p1 TRINITY_DN1339_c0_g1~~TRINITY_DN1339_c0_g1_i10.p1  ORF type:complete len:153 (-),score=31.04 TRINITY_DN1339_c0_g1_i10:105-563(-)
MSFGSTAVAQAQPQAQTQTQQQTQPQSSFGWGVKPSAGANPFASLAPTNQPQPATQAPATGATTWAQSSWPGVAQGNPAASVGTPSFGATAWGGGFGTVNPQLSQPSFAQNSLQATQRPQTANPVAGGGFQFAAQQSSFASLASSGSNFLQK